MPNGRARKATNEPQKAMYGAMRNRKWSAAAGMVSSLQTSLRPSARVWSQPNLPPTRVGPSRSWMRPDTLRSAQMKIRAETATKVTSRPAAIRAMRTLAAA